jgi:3-oxoacyl-[acyl-carrier protein] reductase
MEERKLALITGASRGIGRAIALRLAQDGFDIAAVYARDETAAASLVDELTQLNVRAQAYCCDVSDFERTKEMIGRVNAEMGDIYALVNNAGLTRDKLIARMDEADFDRVIDVNLKGAFHTIRHTYRGFLKRKAGRIVNISSVVGQMGNAGQANYAAAKAGLIGLSKSVAKELASRNVTCNVIAPGMIETDMTEAMPPAAREALLSSIPLGRAGQAAEVAQLVSYLVSDLAGYMTGAVLTLDGGLNM